MRSVIVIMCLAFAEQTLSKELVAKRSAIQSAQDSTDKLINTLIGKLSDMESTTLAKSLPQASSGALSARIAPNLKRVSALRSGISTYSGRLPRTSSGSLHFNLPSKFFDGEVAQRQRTRTKVLAMQDPDEEARIRQNQGWRRSDAQEPVNDIEAQREASTYRREALEASFSMPSAVIDKPPQPVKPFRVLLLHGRGNNAANFRKKAEPLVAALVQRAQGQAVEVVVPDAPFDGGAWFQQSPRGARSYEAEALDGLTEGIAAALALGAAEALPYDAAVGFSQGAILLATLLAQQAAGERPPFARTVVLIGAAEPRPFREQLQLCLAEGAAPLPPSLHVVGDCDDTNPPDSAYAVANAVGGEKLIISGGGHTLPTAEQHLGAIADFILRDV